MTTQPEALQLADEFDWWVARGLNLEPRLADAAAEVRRLHESNTELLAELKLVRETYLENADARAMYFIFEAIKHKARAAIAKAERTTT